MASTNPFLADLAEAQPATNPFLETQSENPFLETQQASQPSPRVFESLSRITPLAAPLALAERVAPDYTNLLLRGGSAEGLVAAGQGLASIAQDPNVLMAGLGPAAPVLDRLTGRRLSRAITDVVAPRAIEAAQGLGEVRQEIREALPVSEPVLQSLPGQIVQGVGQAAGTLPLLFIPGVGLGVGAAASVGQVYQEAYDDAIGTEGVTPEQAHNAAMAALPAASLDVLGDRLVIGRFMKPFVGQPIGRVIAELGSRAVAEGLTEAAQQGWLNVVAAELAKYDPERPLTKELWDSFVVGSAVGSLINTPTAVQGVVAASNQQRREQQQAKQQVLQTALETHEQNLQAIEEDIGSSLEAQQAIAAQRRIQSAAQNSALEAAPETESLAQMEAAQERLADEGRRVQTQTAPLQAQATQAQARAQQTAQTDQQLGEAVATAVLADEQRGPLADAPPITPPLEAVGVQPAAMPEDMAPVLLEQYRAMGIPEELALQQVARVTQPMRLYNLLADIPGHPAGSTITEHTLRQEGYALPEEQPNALPEQSATTPVLREASTPGAEVGSGDTQIQAAAGTQGQAIEEAPQTPAPTPRNLGTLPDNTRVTVMRYQAPDGTTREVVQLDVPGETPADRPVLSGDPEYFRQQGFALPDLANLPEGQTTLGQLTATAPTAPATQAPLAFKETRVANDEVTVWAERDGRRVGRATFRFVGDQAVPIMVEVPERFRRQGIATEIYNYLTATYPVTIGSSGIRTPEGEAFRQTYDARQAAAQAALSQTAAAEALVSAPPPSPPSSPPEGPQTPAFVPPDPSTLEQEPERPQRRAQVMGRANVGQLYTPRSMAEAHAGARRLFDGTQAVSPEATAAAHDLFGRWADPATGLQTAQDILASVGNSELAYGAVQQELFNYALKLAQAGDGALLEQLTQRINLLPTPAPGGGATVFSSARTLAGRSDFSNPLWFTNKLVQQSKDQAVEKTLGDADATRAVRDAVDQAQPQSVAVEEAFQRRAPELVLAIQEAPQPAPVGAQQLAMALPGEGPRPANVQTGQEAMVAAERSLERLLRDLSDTPTFRPAPRQNAVAQAIRDQRQAPVEDSLFIENLQALGVLPATARQLGAATRLAIAAEQRNAALAREQQATQGSVRELVDAIFSASFLRRQDPAWRRQAELAFFFDRGLNEAEALEAQTLFDEELVRLWGEARSRAAAQALQAQPPWQQKQRNAPQKARSDLQKIQQAVRAELTDPTKNWESVLARENGWKGFTQQQHQQLQRLDALIEDENTPIDVKTRALRDVMDIVRAAQIPTRLGHIIADSFTASMFSGLPTFTINTFAPPLTLARNLIIDLITNPLNVRQTLGSFGRAMRAAVPEFRWAWWNDAYSMQQAEYLRQTRSLADLMERGISEIRQGKPSGIIKLITGAQQFVFRTIGALDQAWRVADRQFKSEMYGSRALREAGYTREDITRLVDSVTVLRQQVYEDAIASGASPSAAGVRANEAVHNEFYDAIASATNEETAGVVRQAAQRDADALVGVRSEGVQEKQEGFLSHAFMNPLMEFFTKAINSDNVMTRLGARMLLGVMNVPYRTLRFNANFGPYGLVRSVINHVRTKKGLPTLWQQSYSNHLQARQRLLEAAAGTALMGILPFLAKSTDEDDESEPNGFFVTGAGPSASDPVVRDAWLKKWTPYSITAKVGGRYVTVPLGRAGEAVIWPVALAGAIDDFAWRTRQNEARARPQQLDDYAEVLGNYFAAMGQRGIFSSFRRLGELSGTTYGAQPLESAARTAAYSARPLIPWSGMMGSITRLLTDPIDTRTLRGAVYANLPVIGPMLGKPALNALGDPVQDRTLGGRLIREGLPIVISTKNASSPAYDLTLQKGQGVNAPVRSSVEAIFGPLTQQQWYDYTKTYGETARAMMEANVDRLSVLNPYAFNQALNRVSALARNRAALQMGLARTGGDPEQIENSALEYYQKARDIPQALWPQLLQQEVDAGNVPLLRGAPLPAWSQAVARLQQADTTAATVP